MEKTMKTIILASMLAITPVQVHQTVQLDPNSMPRSLIDLVLIGASEQVCPFRFSTDSIGAIFMQAATDTGIPPQQLGKLAVDAASEMAKMVRDGGHEVELCKHVYPLWQAMEG